MGSALSQVHVDDPLALGDVDLVHVGEHRQGVLSLDRLLLGVYLRGGADLVLRKEPLRFGAGLSAVSVIAPIDGGHGSLSCIDGGSGFEIERAVQPERNGQHRLVRHLQQNVGPV